MTVHVAANLDEMKRSPNTLSMPACFAIGNHLVLQAVLESIGFRFCARDGGLDVLREEVSGSLASTDMARQLQQVRGGAKVRPQRDDAHDTTVLCFPSSLLLLRSVSPDASRSRHLAMSLSATKALSDAVGIRSSATEGRRRRITPNLSLTNLTRSQAATLGIASYALLSTSSRSTWI